MAGVAQQAVKCSTQEAGLIAWSVCLDQRMACLWGTLTNHYRWSSLGPAPSLPQILGMMMELALQYQADSSKEGLFAWCMTAGSGIGGGVQSFGDQHLPANFPDSHG